MVTIRSEQVGDGPDIREVNRQAFGGDDEAELVDQLRETCTNRISLVAQIDDQLVGHLLFTPVVIEATNESLVGMGLAPMSVRPEFQRQGIGSQLIAAGVELLRRAGHPFVVVLGHPEYYPRFGFVLASQFGISCEFDVPDELFMILQLNNVTSSLPAGVAKYSHAFDAWKK